MKEPHYPNRFRWESQLGGSSSSTCGRRGDGARGGDHRAGGDEIDINYRHANWRGCWFGGVGDGEISLVTR